MSTKASEIAKLDPWFPPCGPCAFCGHKDKRHRLWDTILHSPENAADLAVVYELPLAAVLAVRRIRPYQRELVVKPVCRNTRCPIRRKEKKR